MIRNDLDSLPSYVPGKRNENLLKLSSNESSFDPLPSVLAAIDKASKSINRYPDMAATELRTALADHLQLDFEQVAVGCGSSALCQQAVQITAGVGDEVIFPWRSFEAYPIFVQITGATAVPIPLTGDNKNDLKAMAAAITKRTRLIFVCNPNNPTGTIVSKQDFLDFMAAVPKNVLVVLDEAYIEYVRDLDTPLAPELVSHYDNLIGLRTFSKAYGLAGLRVGYAFGNPRIIEALNKVAVPFSVNALAQAAALASLSAPARQEFLSRTEQTVTARELVAHVVGAAHSQANFVWIPGTDAFERAELLSHKGILTRAFNDGLRITVTTNKEANMLIDAWNADIINDFYTQARATNPQLPIETPQTWSFGSDHNHADELAALVAAGKKTATASALWDYEHENEPLPELDELSIITDGRSRPVALIRTTNIVIRRFCDIDEHFARAEGEGDLSLEYWRKTHENFWRRHMTDPRGFQIDMPVLCEEFEVVFSLNNVAKNS
ncbi:histidinol-phosphate aminotransferase [Corynebacterium kutscheri]|uniref:Histidinol-phosphate aminotransferase n=2 Tax=Corynebacterium kutscheri TaxID=35755 RepID=A0A0F6TCG8_9CORY|nr:histidinol-phosphate aminotransferase [Corynebacterium kutscheri]VEH10719.1 Phenylalanine aminotransferase [Corynebacterium kutscheri]